MISANLRRIAADSNVLLSAVIGKAALRVLLHPAVAVVTTEFNIHEVKEYIPYLANKYRFPEKALFLQLQMLPLTQYRLSYYQDKMREAKRFLKERDPDDAHLGALALKEGIPMWSNDRDFQK